MVLGLGGWLLYRMRNRAVKPVELRAEETLAENLVVEESSSQLIQEELASGDGEVSDSLVVLARRVKQILKQEYAGDLSAVAVAKRLRVSERHMRRALKAAEGQNFSKLLQEIRLQQACELLQKRELSIAEVALEVGFGEQSYFSRLFKTRYGQSPSEYRAKFGG